MILAQSVPSRPRGRRSAVAFAALAALAAAALSATLERPLVAQGVGPDAVLRGFVRTGDWEVVVAGKLEAKAEVYQLTASIPSFLILSSALPSPVLLSPRVGTVETVPLLKVIKQKDGSVDLLADADLKPQGRFEVVGEEVRFTANGRRAVMRPRAPLLGLHNAAALFAYSPEYGRGAHGYRPNANAIAKLKAAPPVRVRTYFGSWCPHCKEHVPFLLKVEEQLKGAKVQFEYYGLPQKFGSDPEAKRAGIRSVPTALVFVGGKEVGRIGAEGWAAPETALASLVGAKAAPPAPPAAAPKKK